MTKKEIDKLTEKYPNGYLVKVIIIPNKISDYFSRGWKNTKYTTIYNKTVEILDILGNQERLGMDGQHFELILDKHVEEQTNLLGKYILYIISCKKL